MNYIVLNGIKSNAINGLLISTLPSITKPKIRTEVEEIAGKDGDIVTKLGYSAYDKSFEIGLFGDYDVDEVIAYFNSDGIVTFSNEPDKFYKYQIVNQIDFEKLIRFKKATVTMHVQPFKYSSVDKIKSFKVEENLISIHDYSKTTNGIDVNIEDGEISITEMSTVATEFYIPIDLKLRASDYSLYATSEGQNANATSIRLINEFPSDVDSFGNTALKLINNSTATLNKTLSQEKEYKYLWVKIDANKTVDFSFNLNLIDNTPVNTFIIRNNGNIYAKPKIKITGRGTINISLNDAHIFEIELGNQEFIVIDVAEMEAYKDDTLMNRCVTGDYDKFLLMPGKNEISIAGKVSQVDVENFSRWI